MRGTRDFRFSSAREKQLITRSVGPRVDETVHADRMGAEDALYKTSPWPTLFLEVNRSRWTVIPDYCATAGRGT